MSERNGYPPGVPCWVDTWQQDGDAAAAFYSDLFGWEIKKGSGDQRPAYHMCRMRGRDLAAIGSPPPEGSPSTPAWTTYVWVDSVEETSARAAAAGGSIVVEPFDALDGGRLAIVADPAGAVLGVWKPGEHKGAGLVNEPGAWSMSQLTTVDPEAAKAFYGAVFGWETDSFDMGGAELTMWRVPGYVGGEPTQPVSREVVATMIPAGDPSPEATSSQWSIDFWVDDVDKTAARVVELGGGVVGEPFDTSVGRTGILQDPQGAIFSVSKVGP